MANSKRTLESILALDIIGTLIRANTIEISRLNTAITLLIKAGVPFDLTFTPGTRRTASAATLTVFINPTTTLNFTFQFQEGTLPG
ncbi:MAG: hypothetical protein ACM3UW_01245 [Bacillota bacterium]